MMARTSPCVPFRPSVDGRLKEREMMNPFGVGLQVTRGPLSPLVTCGSINERMAMPKYYIDSSENSSDSPEDALDGPYVNLEDAQAQARNFASSRPGTIFYVNEVKVVAKQVYIAEAVMEMRTEVVGGASKQG